MNRKIILKCSNVTKKYSSRYVFRKKHIITALDDVSLDIYEGEIVALIGESGSGKSTLGKAILRLIKIDSGEVFFLDQNIFKLNSKKLEHLRKKFQMIFQNQAANLHPKMSINQMMTESLKLHMPELSSSDRQIKIDELLDNVGLIHVKDQFLKSLSGGERRRVGLARILSTKPKLIVADEPTSGLDAAIKIQIIDLLKNLKQDYLTYLLISHDLSLVQKIADRVLVMLKGRIIEEISTSRLGKVQHHPYTEKLLKAVELTGRRERDHQDRALNLQTNPIEGCVFIGECLLAKQLGIQERCLKQRPQPKILTEGHWIACFAQDLNPENIANDD